MFDELALVADFHRLTGNPVRDTPCLSGMTGREKYLRLRLMLTELGELSDALGDDDIVKTADALCDLLYVVFGTVVACGYGSVIEELFDEVHRSNMSKTPGPPSPDGNRVLDKGERYRPPQLKQILDQHASDLRHKNSV